VASALLLMWEQWEEESAQRAREILVDMGTYFQVQVSLRASLSFLVFFFFFFFLCVFSAGVSS